MNADLPVKVADPVLAGELADGMASVEEQLLAAVETGNELLSSASRHLIGAGGKRLRPFLVLLGARFGDPGDPRILRSAVAMELTHIGTLYHDDIMDGAVIRRGVPSAHVLWGTAVAVRTGNFFFARASQLIAGLGDEAIGLHARTFMRLIDGQAAETAGPQSEADSLNHHFNVLGNKTASLFTASGQMGCAMSGAAPEVTARVARACEAWGMAYQLSDDVLDVTAESTVAGKAPGADLREGVPTLPMLYAAHSSAPSDARLVDLLHRGQLTDPDLHAEALALLREHEAIDLARAEVRRWAEAARVECAGLPDIPARAVFERLCDFVVERTL
ncbi:polyprenyl synthetase family protein [Streptomyces sp. CA-111067]|uniref:polyprenyl synthetase family protein n=1 Tax=Streptomyces sp. CA-111067 TaxID=3240046 RepID=UPI003D964A9F